MFRSREFGFLALAIASLHGVALGVPSSSLLISEIAPTKIRARISFAPAYLARQNTGYLTGHLSFERDSSLAGLMFGGNERGWHFGAEGQTTLWRFARRTGLALGISSLYASDEARGYFIVDSGLFVSHSVDWNVGDFIPYLGGVVSVPIALGSGQSPIRLRPAAGLAVESKGGARFWGQWTVGVAGEFGDWILGYSFPLDLAEH